MTQIVYIDIDDTLADYSGGLEKAKVSNPSMPFPQAEYGFYAELIPLKGAVNAVRWLLNSPAYSPYILTAPSVMNPMSYTEKRYWVEKYLGMLLVNRLIIASDKSLLKGNYLIDDKLEGHGQDKFEGTLIQYGSKNYSTWATIINELETRC